MFLNWGKIYVWRLLVLQFIESAILTNWYLLAFLSSLKIVQVWAVNYESYFGHFEICGQCLNSTGYFTLPHIEKSVSTSSYFLAFWWSIICMSLITLTYKAYFGHFQKLKHFLYLRNIQFYLLSTVLLWKLYISFRTILIFWVVLILEIFDSGIF